MDKFKMAHEWAMKHGKSDTIADRQNTVKYAWDYADAMQAEENRRSKWASELVIDAEKAASLGCIVDLKSSVIPKIWQPDWEELPSNAKFWAMDESGVCYVYEEEPEISGSVWNFFGRPMEEVGSFGYIGDWKSSLRKRPD